MVKEISGMEYIVNLCILSQSTKDLSTKEHFKHIYGTIKDSYKEKGSIYKALKEGLEFDAAVTLARGTYLLSKAYKKMPEKFPEKFIMDNAIGVSVETLSRI